jgi:hypothetical protein
MTHASVPAEQRAKLGISDNMVRLSVGVEELEDIMAGKFIHSRLFYRPHLCVAGTME